MYESDKPYARATEEQLGKFIPGAVVGSMGKTATQAIDKPRLAMQLDQLARVLSECHSIASHLDQAADRILGPIPQDCAKEGPAPVPSSIEQKMGMAIGYAENLLRRLGETSQRINSAV